MATDGIFMHGKHQKINDFKLGIMGSARVSKVLIAV